jgi:hypothetical protein
VAVGGLTKWPPRVLEPGDEFSLGRDVEVFASSAKWPLRCSSLVTRLDSVGGVGCDRRQASRRQVTLADRSIDGRLIPTPRGGAGDQGPALRAGRRRPASSGRERWPSSRPPPERLGAPFPPEAGIAGSRSQRRVRRGGTRRDDGRRSQEKRAGVVARPRGPVIGRPSRCVRAARRLDGCPTGAPAGADASRCDPANLPNNHGTPLRLDRRPDPR